MKDPTEDARRTMIETGQPERDALAAREHWTTDELQAEFEVIGFMAPFVVVRRKADGVKGTLEFQHGPPRLYFNWTESL